MPSDFDMQVAARTLAQEARGEPDPGRRAVAWVIKNRLMSGRWGRSLSSVCLWRAQFSGWYSPRGNPPVQDPNFAYACGLADGDPLLLQMLDIISETMAAAMDPTRGALFYHASSMSPPPAWAATMRFLGEFGHQRFYTDQPAKEAMV